MKNLKKTLKDIVTGAAIGIGALGIVGNSKAAPEQVNSFSQLNYGGAISIGFSMQYVRDEETSVVYPLYQLMIRTDYSDPSGNSDIPAPRTPQGRKFELGVFRFVEGIGFFPCGWASNMNNWSNYFWNNYGVSGFLRGFAYGPPQCGYDERPNWLFLIDDYDGDGIANVDANGVVRIPGDDGVAYGPLDLIIDGKRANMAAFPRFGEEVDPIEYAYMRIPRLIISRYNDIPFEERGAKAHYYPTGTRSDASGPLDLMIMAENWLSENSSESNYWANGSDWNTDGKVNLDDFYILSKNWNPETYLGPSQ